MTRCRKRAKHISHLPPFRLPALRFGRLGCRPAIKLASDCQVATNDQWRPPVDRQTEDISILLLRMWVNPFINLEGEKKTHISSPPFRFPALLLGRLGCRPSIKLASHCQVTASGQWRTTVDRQTKDISMRLFGIRVNPFINR